VRLSPPVSRHAPSPAPRPGRRALALGSRSASAASWLLVIVAACGCAAPAVPTPATDAPGTPVPTTARSAGPPTTIEPHLDGLLVTGDGALLVTEASGNLRAFDPAPGQVAAVTAAAGEIVVIDPDGQAARLDASAIGPAWVPVPLPAQQPRAVRLAVLAPGGTELAIASGDPQGVDFAVTVLDLTTGRSNSVPVDRGLNGPPSWLGPDTIAVDVIRDPGHSGIATIDVPSGVVTDRHGPGSVVVSSIDGSRLATDDPATGDVLIGDIASWEAGATRTMLRIPGPPATGVEALAMSGDGTRLAVVRRSDTAGSIEILVRVGDDWRSVRTLTRSAEGPIVAAWLE